MPKTRWVPTRHDIIKTVCAVKQNVGQPPMVAFLTVKPFVHWQSEYKETKGPVVVTKSGGRGGSPEPHRKRKDLNLLMRACRMGKFSLEYIASWYSKETHRRQTGIAAGYQVIDIKSNAAVSLTVFLPRRVDSAKWRTKLRLVVALQGSCCNGPLLESIARWRNCTEWIHLWIW